VGAAVTVACAASQSFPRESLHSTEPITTPHPLQTPSTATATPRAQDNQSVDRAYRIGQSRDVVVYRLVTCGTVEEKIYRKQIYKGGLSRTGIQDGVQLRCGEGREWRGVGGGG